MRDAHHRVDIRVRTDAVRGQDQERDDEEEAEDDAKNLFISKNQPTVKSVET